MKNEKLIIDIGILENIVILKVIDIPKIEISAKAIEKCPNDNDDGDDVSISFTTSAKDRDLGSVYVYSCETGDNWEFIFPSIKNCINFKTKALTFSNEYKVEQFVKCFKKAIAEVNSQIEPPIDEEKSAVKWERCE